MRKKLTDLQFDKQNFNKGSEKGNRLLEKSLQKFGFREAATLDKNGVLIGGNKRTAKAGEIGMEEVEIIKADPSKVYALQYDDIDIDTPQGRELALALNQTAKENIVFDAEVIEATLEEAVIEEWGVSNDTFNYAKGHDANNMDEGDLDLQEEFNPIGSATDLHKIIFLFDSEIDAKDWIDKIFPEGLEYKKFGGGQGKMYQVNYSTVYGIQK